VEKSRIGVIMKVYNQEKTKILNEYDLSKGYLKEDKIVSKIIPSQEEIKEEFHYEFKEYPNGGKDRIKIIDIPYQPFQEEKYEYEDIQIFIPYTEKEKAEIRIAELKEFLKNTDYKALQFAEGELSAENFEPIKQQRKKWREEINKWELLIK
jgi:hypothetical protein